MLLFKNFRISKINIELSSTFAISFISLLILVLLELENVIETIRFQSITYVPCLPTYISGVINLRGRIIPVINMH
ncbi:chemotaxis protein CheW, partial [Clostridioides difficile]|uniref:chemotaxis protein CheW n=1 Tax=Clostridioides difficile TaxID=1496 RepID=UPI00155A26C2